MVYNPSKETYILSSVNLTHGKTSHLRNVIMTKLHVYTIVRCFEAYRLYIKLGICFHPSFCVIGKNTSISYVRDCKSECKFKKHYFLIRYHFIMD